MTERNPIGPQARRRSPGGDWAPASEGGFTLIELMLVVVIIGIMVGLAVTRLDLLVPKYRLRAAAREVASVLKQGKARAAAQGKDVYFEVDLAQGRFWLLAPFPKPEEAGDTRPVESRPLQYEPVFVRQLPDGVHFVDVILGDKEKFTSGRARVRLSAFGASSHVILNLVNTDDVVIAVRMNGFTGLLQYFDQHRDADELLEDKGT
jgi:prepilin-type N-terminal cleavage/methylation domain-containing protein